MSELTDAEITAWIVAADPLALGSRDSQVLASLVREVAHKAYAAGQREAIDYVEMYDPRMADAIRARSNSNG